jgi:MFS family permease
MASPARVRDVGIHYAWLVLGATAVAMLAASGLRASFGVFIRPIEAEFAWDRTVLSAVASVSFVVNGLSGPVVGRLADRWGPRGVLAASGVLLGAGALGAATVVTLWQLLVTVGVLLAMGGAGAAPAVAAAVAARWFDARRGLVLGIGGGALAAGQLLVVPVAMGLTVAWGWRAAFAVLGAGFLGLVLPIVLGVVRNDPGSLGLHPYGAVAPARAAAPAEARPARTGLSEAMRTAPFWLLAGSFGVCGYTSSGLVLTHLIPHAAEHGFQATVAAQALGVMGAFNIVGTIASGWICDRFGLKGPLAAYYALRGLSLAFLPYLDTAPGLFAWAMVFGLNYISTVPATTALTARIYGRYSVGELSGWIFLSHQMGSAVGSLAGGYLYDRLGDYTMAFHTAAAVAMAAAVMVLAIREELAPPPARPAAVVPAAGA